jgi:hypothetical protein
MAQAQPPEPEPAAARDDAEGLSTRAEAPKPQAKSAAGPTRPVSPAELLKQADVANRSGDKAQEVMLLRAALSSGAQGSQRLAALSRLCDVEFELGRRQSALEICRWVMKEAPGSSEARVAQRRVQSALESEADEAQNAKPAVTQ